MVLPQFKRCEEESTTEGTKTNEDAKNPGARAHGSAETEGLGKKEEEPPVVVDANVPTAEVKYYTAKVEKSPVTTYERASAASGVVEKWVDASRVKRSRTGRRSGTRHFRSIY